MGVEEIVQVKAGGQVYKIRIGCDNLQSLPLLISELGDFDRIALITNETVWNLYDKLVRGLFSKWGTRFFHVIVPDGEQYKSLSTFEHVIAEMARNGMGRLDLVVALGGGVVGDMAGYCAASYMRSVSLIQIPTTLLAMVDSSIGGKVGLNIPAGKNMVGSFYHPRMVLTDLSFLDTLDEREYGCGLAEIIKYALALDKGFYDELSQTTTELLQRDKRLLPGIVARCCQLKAEIVALDERDNGSRRLLNFGHTFGHAFEAVSGYEILKHGEAVWLGMHAALHFSVNWFSETGWADEVSALLKNFTNPLFDQPRIRTFLSELDREKTIGHMRGDKKNKAGAFTLIALKSIGHAEVITTTDSSLIGESIGFLKSTTN